MNSSEEDLPQESALKILLCGGIAGIATWASVFPLDMVKTRLQAQQFPGSTILSTERESLLRQSTTTSIQRPQRRLLSSIEIAKQAYRSEGIRIFYRGLGICSIRAFIVNAVQV